MQISGVVIDFGPFPHVNQLMNLEGHLEESLRSEFFSG